MGRKKTAKNEPQRHPAEDRGKSGAAHRREIRIAADQRRYAEGISHDDQIYIQTFLLIVTFLFGGGEGDHHHAQRGHGDVHRSGFCFGNKADDG